MLIEWTEHINTPRALRVSVYALTLFRTRLELSMLQEPPNSIPRGLVARAKQHPLPHLTRGFIKCVKRDTLRGVVNDHLLSAELPSLAVPSEFLDPTLR
jgi:hypothetical protein